MAIKSPRHLIVKVLSPAVRLWLRSQVEAVDELHFEISGGNRQILTGYIPSVSLNARCAVYQGLHLSQAEIEGENIRINLSEAIKGKPLHLLEPIPIFGEVSIAQNDLQASLSSPLLKAGLKDVLSMLMKAGEISDSKEILKDWQIDWHSILVERDRVTVKGIVTNLEKETISLALKSQVELASPHDLRLSQIEIDASPQLPKINLAEFNIDLGEGVALQELSLDSEGIEVRGGVTVLP
ncbi:DUF2993 domain-containing protein [Lusitaniella coriacea LEGE 07157]|uniref:DUF2993 domain-containing protein n=1 Tax=Lusitaniella coriacea LEGE 07157 TaxID=945747 RepID=A0A8J7AZC6_9CYAN|nr:DUF2993 domain-containing protein [Lusitaniella coriacea]MBE9115484.1 DUF2993 domain-containing protein [Lusitaniella coriacea LEGE 07157]